MSLYDPIQFFPTEDNTNVVHVVVIVGGCNSALYRHLRVCRPHYCFGIDVAQELPDVSAVRAQLGHVKLFSLATGQTADTLFADAAAESRDLVRYLAGMDAANGLGMLRGVGAQAAQQLVTSTEWSRAKQELIDDLLIICKGSLQHLVVELLGSVCGGTAAGGLQIIGHDLATSLSDALGINVHVDFEVTGMITFLSLGQRIGENAATALADLADYVIRKEADTRITKSLSLVEYPPLRRDKAKRDSHVLLDVQARAAREVQQELNRIAPNGSMNGRLGNITLRTVDYFAPLEAAAVAKAVADFCSVELQTLLDHAAPDPRLVRDIQLSERTVPLPREGVAEIAYGALDQDFDELVAAITQRNQLVHFEPVAEMSNGETFHLATAASLWALPPESPQEALERMIGQGAICDAINDRIDILEDQRLDLEEEMSRLRSKLVSIHGTIQRTQLTDCVRGLLTSLESKLRKFEDKALMLRETADEAHLLDARLAALRSVLRLVEAELAHLRGHIGSIIHTLRLHRPAVLDDTADPPVTVRDLVTVWRDLWVLPTLSRNEQLHLIMACVAGVTVAGLARITGAQPPRLETIAERIARGQVATMGPPWGGQARSGHGIVINVIPPTERTVARELRRLITEHNPDTVVAFADTAEAGANIVRLTFQGIGCVAELYPTLLRHKLIEAQQDPLRNLFLPFGDAALERLGIGLQHDFAHDINSQDK